MFPTQHLIPKTGLTVINPITRQPLPKQGAVVEMTPYWHRRIKDGDVTAKAKTPKEKKA